MAISIEADPSLAQGYIKINGTTAATVTTGGVSGIANGAVTQAKLAANVAGNGPAFRAWASTTTTLPNNSVTTIALATENFDTNNNFANSRFTPTVAGYYFITGTIAFSGVMAYVQALIRKNSTTYAAGGHTSTPAFGNQVSDVVYLNGSSDYVELAGVQASGSSQNIANSEAYTFMSGYLVRAA